MYNSRAHALGTNRSCIRELFEYGRARAAIVGVENVYDYSLGNPSIPTPPEVTRVLQELLAEDPLALHGYTSAAGDEAVRAAIARDLNQRYGCAITPEELFLGCGAAPALTAVFRALAFPGVRFLAISPYFPEYVPFVQEAGGIFDAVAPDIPAFQIRLAELEAALTPQTAAIIVNSPNNPSGTVYSAETLEALARILRRKSEEFGHPIYIISDEPYRELVYDGVQAPFLPGIYENTIVCYSYSKSLSLPGERIGYVYVPREATDGPALYGAIAGAARAMGHVCAPSLLQKVIGRCTHLRPDLEAYDRNRRDLFQGLTAAGYEIARPEGAFYLFVKAPGGDAKTFSERAKELDLLLVPGDDFGCPGYFRICYCVSNSMIHKSLPIFRQLIQERTEDKP